MACLTSQSSWHGCSPAGHNGAWHAKACMQEIITVQGDTNLCSVRNGGVVEGEVVVNENVEAVGRKVAQHEEEARVAAGVGQVSIAHSRRAQRIPGCHLCKINHILERKLHITQYVCHAFCTNSCTGVDGSQAEHCSRTSCLHNACWMLFKNEGLQSPRIIHAILAGLI